MLKLLMSPAIVTDAAEIKRLVQEAVEQALEERLPRLVRKATCREWLTKDDLKELTGWSSRTIQHLRDPGTSLFSQHGPKNSLPHGRH